MKNTLTYFCLFICLVNTSIGQTEEALLNAIKNCDLTDLSNILQRSDQNWRDSSTVPFPLLAAQICGKELLPTLKKHKFDFQEKSVLYLDEKQEEYYGSLLAIAANKGDLALLKYLIEDLQLPIDEQEWNPQTKQADGRTALHWAIIKGQKEMVQYLLEHQANIALEIKKDGGTPLIYAIIYKQLPIVKILLEAGVDINQTNHLDWSPIHYAAEVNAYEICDLLLRKGAALNTINHYGYTPLGIAQTNDYHEIAQLIQQYASTNKANTVTQTEVVLQRNLDAVNHLQFSKDGRLLLINDHLFDIRSGKEISNYQGLIAQFTPDEKLLVHLDGKGGIPTLWNWKEQELIGQFAAEGGERDYLTKSPYYDNQQIYIDANNTYLITAYGTAFLGWNILTGKKEAFPALRNAHLLSSTASGSYLAKIDSTEKLSIFKNFNDAQPVQQFSIAQEGYHATYVEIDQAAKKIAIGYQSNNKEDFLIQVYQIDTQQIIASYSIAQKVTTFSFSPTGNCIAYATDDTLTYLQPLTKKDRQLLPKQHTKTISALKFSPDGNYLVSGSQDKSAILYQVSDQLIIQTFKGSLQQDIGSKINTIQFSADGHWLLNGRIAKVFDIENLEVYQLYSTSAAISANKKYIAKKGIKENKLNIQILDATAYTKAYSSILKTKELATFPPIQTLIGHQHKIEQIIISPDNKKVLSYDANNTVFAWSIATGKPLLQLTMSEKVEQVKFDPSSNSILLKTEKGPVRLYELSSTKQLLVAEQILFSPTGKWIGHTQAGRLIIQDQQGVIQHDLSCNKEYAMGLAFSNDERYLTYFDNNFHIACYDLAAKKLRFHFESSSVYTHTIFSPDNKYFLLKSGKMIEVWSMETGKKRYFVEELAYSIADIILSPDGQYLVTVGDNEYSILLREIATGKSAFKIFFPGSSLSKGQFVISTPDGYYRSSKEAAPDLSFKRGFATYPFEQFDLRFNRPDIISERLGYDSPILSAAYKKAFEKRLTKLGFSTAELSNNLQIPALTLISEKIPSITKTPELTIQVQAKDEVFPLNSINVWINDVPVFGRKGMAIARLDSIHQLQKDIPLTLSEGDNKIQVSCYNTQGIESLKQTISIQYTPKQSTLPDLHLIGIGVSKYKDARMNLDFPVKDIQDVLNSFEEQKHNYANIHTTFLLDQQATKQGLERVRQQLLNSKVADKVLVYYAGHGIIDEQLNYYLAAFNTDFQQPALNSFPYDALESLLDGIPARKKLILVDACHAGEIDKEYTTTIKKTNSKKGALKFRAVANKQLTYTKLGSQNSFELMKKLFVDLRRGTGATIIASAGAVQPAVESTAWNNSAFAHVLLQALQDNAADGVISGLKDNQIMVSELQQFLHYTVPVLTNGLQQPTSRGQNVSNDFRIW